MIKSIYLGFGKGYYLTNNVTTIQKEIMAHGPISAIFDVYGDFYQYSSGVYVVSEPLSRVTNHF